MKHIKLKDLLNEMEMPNFPTEKSNRNPSAEAVDGMIKALTPQQLADDGEIYSLLHKWFEMVKKDGGDMMAATLAADEAFRWNDLDTGLIHDYFGMEKQQYQGDPYDLDQQD